MLQSFRLPYVGTAVQQNHADMGHAEGGEFEFRLSGGSSLVRSFLEITLKVHVEAKAEKQALSS